MKRFLFLTVFFVCLGALAEGKTLVVSSLGFNPKDSTAILQKALDSDAARIVIDKQASPWITGPLFCRRGDLEIVIEKGVEVRALKGAFKGRYESLLTIDSQRNITIEGNGAVMSMNKADYQNRKLYRPAEWRHLVNLLSAESITIRDVTLAKSGGDGVYVGVSHRKNALPYCKDITLANVICDDNHRQGISVISVDGLVIEGCVFENTRGTSPEDGIDFEPNKKLERLTRCVIRNSRFADNEGAAVGTFIRLSGEAPPIEVLLENCFIGGYINLGTTAGRFSTVKPVGGEIRFLNCKIEGKGTLFEFSHHRSDSCRAVFENCTITRTGGNDKPLMRFFNSADILQPAGNVYFKNCEVKGAVPRTIEYISSYSKYNRAEKIEGVLENDGKKIDLAAYVKAQGFDKIRFNPDRRIDWKQLDIRSTAEMIPSPRVRGPVAFILSARNGGTVKFTLRFAHPVSGKINSRMKLKLIGPDGKNIALPDADKVTNEYEFNAATPGNYRLECNPNGMEAVLVRSSVPFVLMPVTDNFIHMFKPREKLFLAAEPGSEVSVLIGGEGSEHVTAILEDDGKELASVQKATAVTELKGRTRNGRPVVDVKHSVEDVKFRIPGPALPVFTNNPAVQFDRMRQ